MRRRPAAIATILLLAATAAAATARAQDGVATKDGYTGDWRQGKREGHGVQIVPSPRASEMPGYRDGPPKFSPGRYDGEWKDDRPDGQGSYTLPDSGRTVSGTWHRGCFDDGNDRIALRTPRASCGFR